MDRRFQFARTTTSRILIGAGVEPQLTSAVRELRSDGPVVLLHDAALGGLAARIATALGARASISIGGGEAQKDFATIARLAAAVSETGATRGTALVALGGGTTTDTVGFLAAIYLRGVPLVLCPTTTLAMCDAAIGGKNGIDHGGLKNRIGTIRQPDLVCADTDWLDTLPLELFREGIVEVVKKAAVLDAGHFARLEALAPDLVARRPAAIAETIALAVQMKMDVVLADETETGRRRWLNFGHTIGHAIESLAGGELRHGSCVAIGLIAECRAAGDLVPAATTARLARLLAALGVASELPANLHRIDELWRLAQKDKKAHAGTVPMIVPTTLGNGTIAALTRDGLAHAFA